LSSTTFCSRRRSSIWRASRGWPACQRNQFCLCRAVRISAAGRSLGCICGSAPIQTPPRPMVSCPLDIGDAGIQSLGDPAVTPAIASCRYVGLQQNTRLRQQLRGTLARVDQVVELRSLFRAQPDNIFFERQLLSWPRITSVAGCDNSDSEHPSNAMTRATSSSGRRIMPLTLWLFTRRSPGSTCVSFSSKAAEPLS